MVRHFEKDVLKVGAWHLPGGGVFKATPKVVRHLGQRLTDMLEDGLQIPFAWEHQPKAKPMTEDEADQALKDKVQRTLGHAKAGQMGEDDATVLGLLEVPVDADGDAVAKAKYVSPEIVEDFIDGRGKMWPGLSISHIALTARPVQHDQSPAREVVALSHEGKPRWKNAVWLSWDAVARLAEEEPPPFVKKGEGEEEPPPKPEAPPPPPDPAAAGGGDAAKLATVREALAKCGIILPPDTNRENMLDVLHTSALTMAHHAGESKGGTKDDQEEEEEPPMSTTTQEPKEVQTPYMMSMEKRLKAAENRQVKAERLALGRRLKDLREGGWLSVAQHKALHERANTVQLSFDDDGNLKVNRLLMEIEVLEQKRKEFAESGVLHGPHGRPGVSRLSQESGEVEIDPAGNYPDNTQANRKQQEAAGDDLASRTMTAK